VWYTEIKAVSEMSIKLDDVKSSLQKLITQGHFLYFTILYEGLDENKRKQLVKQLKIENTYKDKLINFNTVYETWYSEAIIAIKLFIPDRLNDFISLYKNEKRKSVNFSTYTISDAIIGLEITNGLGNVLANRTSAAPKMQQQVSILESAAKSVESVIYSLQFTLRADLFDSELDAARGLLKASFLRATGAMCGVMLEKHLANVCVQHGVSIKKKSPTINDFNEELKNSSVIDLPTWRHIQMLGDLRNLCCHDKNTEPTKEQASDLLTGTEKIIKTVF
jgi:hypothetical protein